VWYLGWTVRVLVCLEQRTVHGLAWRCQVRTTRHNGRAALVCNTWDHAPSTVFVQQVSAGYHELHTKHISLHCHACVA
jgi:hypothetical protein